MSVKYLPSKPLLNARSGLFIAACLIVAAFVATQFTAENRDQKNMSAKSTDASGDESLLIDFDRMYAAIDEQFATLPTLHWKTPSDDLLTFNLNDSSSTDRNHE